MPGKPLLAKPCPPDLDLRCGVWGSNTRIHEGTHRGMSRGRSLEVITAGTMAYAGTYALGWAWTCPRDSHPRPPDPKSGALSAELRARGLERVTLGAAS